MSRFLSAGKFVSLHGVRGELKIYPYCDSAEMLVAFEHLYIDPNGKQKINYSRLRAANGMVIIKIVDVDSVEAARKYIDRQLYFNRDDVELEEGAYFIADLLGCHIVDAVTSEEYGKLSEVTSNGAHDIYHVRFDDGSVRYIPVVKDFIETIDLENRVILVKPIPGMLED